MKGAFAVFIGAVDKLGQGALSQSRFTDDGVAVAWALKRAAKAGGTAGPESILLVDEIGGDRWWILPKGDGFERRPA